MPTPYTAVFKKLSDNSYMITLVRGELGIVIPGFRLYHGQIQAPARKSKSNWYPSIYFDEHEATDIYSAIVLAAPEGQYILPAEGAIAKLLHNPAVLEHLDN